MALDALLLLLSNIGIVIVTGWLIIATVKTANNHSDAIAKYDDQEQARLVRIIDTTIQREQAAAHGAIAEEAKESDHDAS